MARMNAPWRGLGKAAGRPAGRAFCSIVLSAIASGAPAYADPPPWTPVYGLYTQQGSRPQDPKTQQLVYRLPPGLRDGRCRPEMFDSAAVHGLTGAAGGAQIGAAFGRAKGKLSATALGALISAAIGHSIGNGIARPEEICFSQSFEHVPDRESVAWMDPVEGVHYSVTPTKTVKAADGRYCREYEARATVNGQAAGTYGTACRQRDGSWELMN